MLGAIIGDMVGSIYEFHNIKSKNFEIYNPKMEMTDDSILTIAVARTLKNHYPFDSKEETIKAIQQELCEAFVEAWDAFPYAGWGGNFSHWCSVVSKTHNFVPYHSCGNGSAMRVSSVAWIAKNEAELKLLSKTVTEITHNHPEGIKGAEAVALCIFMALNGASKEEIKERMINEYYPEIASFNYDDLVKNYGFYEICQLSVPQGIYSFLISNSYEDAVRNCIGIGGDCDTTGAMAGAIAEAYYARDKFDDFEKEFFDKIVKTKVQEFVKEFHRVIGSKKFDK